MPAPKPEDADPDVSSSTTAPPALPEIDREFRALFDLVFGEVASWGYDTSEGEPPSPQISVRAAFADTDDAPLGDFFLLTVAWDTDRPFGTVGELPVETMVETPSGAVLNLVALPGGESTVWFTCAGGVVSLDLVIDVDSQSLTEFGDRLHAAACS